jgi:tight adherence protein B
MAFLVALVTFLIVAGILAAAFFLSGGGKKENIVRRRLEAIEKGEKRGNTSLELQLMRDELLSDVPVINRFLMRWSWSKRLRAFVAQAGMQIKPGKLVLVSLTLGIGAFIGIRYIYRSPILAVVGAVAALLLPLGVVAFRRMRRFKAFEKTFPEAIDLLCRAVRAGHAFATGIEMIGTELGQPVAGEFRTAFEEQNFGLPLKDALLNLSERMPLIDVRFFVTAVLIQKETGGNLAEILDNLSHVIRERFKILGEVRIKTTQGRLTAGILIALPPFMIALLRFLNPDYMNPLFEDPWGPYMLGTAAVMQVIGALLLWKIVNIEV